MKSLFIIFFASLFCSSCSPSFYHKNGDLSDMRGFDMTELDTTFNLYVKSICKKFVDGVSYPCNCAELKYYDLKDVVENEFLFLSKDKEKAVVINYIKDRDQKFFDNEKEVKSQAIRSRDTVEVNVWYINQIRFGIYDIQSSEIEFVTTWRPFETHVWGMSFDGEDVVIEAVGKAVEDGFDQKLTNLSLLVVPKFYRASNFNILFEDPNSTVKPSRRFLLPGNRIYVNKKRDQVNFFFDAKIINNHNLIVFNSNRLYSYYPEKNSVLPSEIYRKQKMRR